MHVVKLVEVSSDISSNIPALTSMEVDGHDHVPVHDVFEMELLCSKLLKILKFYLSGHGWNRLCKRI
ncbi:hypothetical protein MKX01_003567 [Papaver californicum]|nr:hypothetical protein MKX01_003567 [Papaver californicum]